MNQLELLNMDEYDVLRRDVDAIGGAKSLAALLFPDDDPVEQGKWVNNCLDRKRKQKFEPDHYTVIINEARKRNQHSEYLEWLCRATWHEPPQPKELESEVAQMSARLNSLTDQAKETIDYLVKAKEQLGWDR